MRVETVDTYAIQIFMAGDLADAKRVCRSYCLAVGLCVAIEPTTYIYTGGEEAGIRVGLINYPRFPSAPADLWRRAKDLAEMLRRDLCQHSYSIMAPDKTEWVSYRPD